MAWASQQRLRPGISWPRDEDEAGAMHNVSLQVSPRKWISTTHRISAEPVFLNMISMIRMRRCVQRKFQRPGKIKTWYSIWGLHNINFRRSKPSRYAQTSTWQHAKSRFLLQPHVLLYTSVCDTSGSCQTSMTSAIPTQSSLIPVIPEISNSLGSRHKWARAEVAHQNVGFGPGNSLIQIIQAQDIDSLAVTCCHRSFPFFSLLGSGRTGALKACGKIRHTQICCKY